MQYIIGILLAIAILGLLLGLFYLLLQVALITIPAWGVAVALVPLTLHLFRSQRIHQLGSQGTLAKMITVRFDGKKLNWHLEDFQIESYAETKLAMFFSIIIGITSIWTILSVLS